MLWRRDAGVGRSAVAPVVLVLSAVLVLFVALVLLVALAHLVALAVLMALVLWTLIRIQADNYAVVAPQVHPHGRFTARRVDWASPRKKAAKTDWHGRPANGWNLYFVSARRTP